MQKVLTQNQPIDEFCNRWRITRLSSDKHDATEESDFGLSIKFEPDAEWSLCDQLRMQREFEALTGHSVRLRRDPITVTGVKHRHAMHLLYHA